MFLALLLQILTPVWAAATPQEALPGTIQLFGQLSGSLDAFPICSNTDAASPAALPSHDDHGTSHRLDLSCAACHFCCHLHSPLPLGQIELPLPCGTGFRLAESVQVTSPRGPPSNTAWARAPPAFS